MPPRAMSVTTAYAVSHRSSIDDWFFLAFIDQTLGLENLLLIHNQVRKHEPLYYPGVFPVWDESHLCPQEIKFNAYFACVMDMAEHMLWKFVFIPHTFTKTYIITKEGENYLWTYFNPMLAMEFIHERAREKGVSVETILAMPATHNLDWSLNVTWRSALLTGELKLTVDALLRIDESASPIVDDTENPNDNFTEFLKKLHEMQQKSPK